MTNLLVKWFVKDNQEIGKVAVRTRYGVLSSVVGIICNCILFIAKFIIGMCIHSISVTADAFNNLSDAASSCISLVGVKLASRPADKEHPFGHGRYEYIAALAIAFLVLQVGFTCFKNAFVKVLHPELVTATPITIAILVISILLKVWLGIFNKTLGKRIDSKVMKATAADAFGDVKITSATVISLLIGQWTGLKVDGFIGVVVSFFVLYAGFNIAKDTLEPLIGEAVTVETYEKITKKVESYQGILGTHDLIVHNYGPNHTMATIHAEVPSDMALEKAHDTIDAIERDVLRELDIFLVIHMDPLEINNKVVQELKEYVVTLIKEIDEEASIHDFRVVGNSEQKNLIFDLVVPHEYSIKREHKLVNDIMERVSQENKNYQCVITLEHSYINS